MVSYNIKMVTAAFIFNDDKILLIKRSHSKTLHPNIWTGVGGHLEEGEFSSPKKGCLREVFEETGIREDELSAFDLRYIVLSKKNTEIYQQFIYFGETDKKDLIQSVEGELHWIPRDDVFNRPMPNSHYFVLRHYLDGESSNSEVLIGVSGKVDDREQIIWNPVYEWATAHRLP